MVDATVRPMRAADLSAVVRLEQTIFPQPWEAGGMADMQADPLAYCPVAVVEEEIVGYAFTWMVSGEVHLANLAVAPTQRRRGIARTLVEAVLAEGRRRRAEACFLEVRRSNRPAITLYERLGFIPVGVRKRYYPDNREDALLMARQALDRRRTRPALHP